MQNVYLLTKDSEPYGIYSDEDHVKLSKEGLTERYPQCDWSYETFELISPKVLKEIK